MSYRDDLDAAHARIAALEAALRERGDGEEADDLREALNEARERLAAANRQVTALQAESDRLLAEIEQAQQKLAGRQRPGASGLRTLYDYNRGAPASSLGFMPAGITCPVCAQLGEEVEMRGFPRPAPLRIGSDVFCPRCLFDGFLRVE